MGQIPHTDSYLERDTEIEIDHHPLRAAILAALWSEDLRLAELHQCIAEEREDMDLTYSGEWDSERDRVEAHRGELRKAGLVDTVEFNSMYWTTTPRGVRKLLEWLQR